MPALLPAGQGPVEQPGGFLSGYPWCEYLEESTGNGLGEAAFGRDSSQAAMTILCFDDDLYQPGGQGIITSILGYAQTVNYAGSEQKYLSRVLPMRHPRYGMLWANKVTRIKGHTWLNKQMYGWGPQSRHAYAVVTIGFVTPPYYVLSDSELSAKVAADPTITGSGEWLRFTVYEIEPTSHTLTPEQGTFTWTGGSPGDGQDFTLGASIFLPKARLKWTWVDLPASYVFNAKGAPATLLGFVGKVNSKVFSGYNPGTLLMEDPQVAPKTAPVDGAIYGLAPGATARTYDVTFNMLYYEPPGGNPTDYTKAGHNIYLYPGTSNFYPIKTKGSGLVPSGQPVYAGADFALAWAGVP